jgi:tRNA:m4X modification enzyme
MRSANLLSGDFVEYGAGKAGLSSFIALDADKKSTFIVVERESRRNKKDKEIRALGLEVCRETMDIKDFDLGFFKEKKQIIGVAKHLCGGATDLSLTSF